MRWINELISKAGLVRHVDWLGAIPAPQVVRELQSAGAVLIPSYVESYCVGFCEALRVGTPTVAAFSGGTAHLGRDEETCLFFPAGDVAMCASQLERALSDQELAARLSRQARVTASARHDRTRLVRHQTDTYSEVLQAASEQPLVAHAWSRSE
jgi:glycosyltransferase involved in cell wall biosynthesis